MRRTTTILALSVLLLTSLGLVMLASTSAMHGAAQFQDANYFVKRQLAALLLGVVGAMAVSRVNYLVWKQIAIPLAVFSAILLVLVMIPGIGISVKGSRRWLSLGVTTMQPSEIAKIALVLLLAWWLNRAKRRVKEWIPGVIIPLALMGALVLPVLAEPDFGTTILMAAVSFMMLWIGGAQFRHLLVAGAAGASGMAILIMQNEVRMRRIIAFLDPERYADREAYQLLNAIYAFVAGGGSGVGLGAGLQKRHYLPESHTDFIFAIIGEELGLGASLATLALFAVIFICGLRIAMRAPDTFGRLVALGLTCMITTQAAINLGVVTGCLPTKGLPLPFISYGGTSLAITWVMVGLLIGIARQGLEDDTPWIEAREKAQRF